MALSTTQYGYIIDPMVPFTDGKGNTIKDGFVRVFVAGSSTHVVTYRNFDGAANQDLIELDNSGRTKTSVIGSKGLTYKVCVYDQLHSQESPILTVDKVSVIGANITAGAGATVVTGLDGLTTKPDGFVDASVVGTDGYVALDHTLVTDDLNTDAKVTAVENDRYVPLLNEDVNDPDSKITLKRLRQWANRPTQVVISPSDFIGTGLSNNEWAAAVDAMEDDKTAVVKWTESGATRVAFSSRYEAGVGLVFISEIGGFVTEYVVSAASGAHAVTTNVYELAGSHSITSFDVMWDNEGNDYVFPSAQDVIQAVSEYIDVHLVFNAPTGVKYVYSLTYKSGVRYEWTREDCQGKFNLILVTIVSPYVWAWTSGDTILKQDIASLVTDLGKIGDSIAPAYTSLTFPIAEGTLCMYARRLYTCSASGGIPASEDWTAAHWTQTNVAEIIGNVDKSLFVFNTDAITDWIDITNEFVFLNDFRAYYHDTTILQFKPMYSPSANLLKFFGEMRINRTSEVTTNPTWTVMIKYVGNRFYTNKNAPTLDTRPTLYPFAPVGGLLTTPVTDDAGVTKTGLAKMAWIGSNDSEYNDEGIGMQIIFANNPVYGTLLTNLIYKVTPIIH